MMEVSYVWLPKGAYAKLQTIESGFSDNPNHKAVLETSLRQYYKFTVDEDTWKRVTSKGAKIVVNLEPVEQDGDTDLYVSRHPLLFPTRHQHNWSSHDIGSKKLVLGSEDTNMGPGNYSVAVYGFKGTSKILVSITVEDISMQKSGQHAASSSSVGSADTVECGNCNCYIPLRTVALHEAYCIRHNIVCKHPGCGVVPRTEEVESHIHCEKCGQAFQRAEIEKHMKVFHEPLQWPCGIVLEKEKMVQHQTSECPLRLITCRFCGDMVQAGTSPADARDRIRGLSEHESHCGSRTAPCDSCGRSVMLKDMDIHHVAVHQKN